MNSHSLWRSNGRRFLTSIAGVFVFLFCFFAIGAEANAATCTFTAASSTDWNTDANWSCGHEPLVSDDVVLPLGLATTTVMSADATAQNVTIQTGAGLNLNGNTLEVNGSWVNTGLLIPTMGTVKFIGTTLATIGTEPNFYHLTVDKTFGALELAGNVTTTGNYTLTQGTVDLKSFVFSLGGNFDLVSGTFTAGSTSTVRFFGTADQSLSAITNFENVQIVKTSGTVILVGNATFGAAGGMLTMVSSTLNTDNWTLNVGQATILSGASVTTTDGGVVNFNGYVTSSGIIGGFGGVINFLTTSTNNGTLDAGSYASGRINFSTTHTNNGTIDVHHGIVTANGDLINIGTIDGGSLSGELVLNLLWQQIGTFNKQTGRVTFGGGIDQMIPSETYNQLRINKTSGTAALAGNATTSNMFYLDAGTFSFDGNQLKAYYYWYNGGGTVDTSAGGSIMFTGSSPQLVQETIFPNIIVEKAANEVTQTGNVSSTGNFTVNDGNWDADAYNLNVSSTTMIVSGSQVASVAGNMTFGNVTSTGTLGTVSGILLFNSTTTNNGVLNLGDTQATFMGAIVNNNIINAGAADVNVYDAWNPGGTFNAGSSEVFFRGTYFHVIPALSYYNMTVMMDNPGDAVTVGGHVTTTRNFELQQGTLNIMNEWMSSKRSWYKHPTNASFDPGSGTVELYFPSSGYVTNNGTFYNLSISKSAWSTNIQSDINVANNFSVTGSHEVVFLTWDLHVTGTSMISVASVSSTSGSMNFVGSVSSTGGIESDSGNVTFNSDYVNNGSFYAGSGDTLHDATTTNNGSYNVETGNVTTTASFTSAGVFNLGSGLFAGSESMSFGAGTETSNGGIFRLYTPANQTIIGWEPSGLWNFHSVKTGGWIVTNANINVTGNLDMAGGGATLLTGGTSMTVTGTTMIASGDIVTSTAGTLTFVGAFNNSGSLLSDGNVNINGTVTNGGLIDMDSPGDLVFGAIVTNNGTIDHENGGDILFEDDFINNGTFNGWGQSYFNRDWLTAGAISFGSNSIFTFNGPGDQDLPSGLVSRTLEINKSGGTATLLGNASAYDVNLQAGIFDLGGFTFDLLDDWSNTGGTLTGNGMVDVRGTLTQTLSTESNFYILEINKTIGTVNMSGNVTTTNRFTLNNGTFNIGNMYFAVTGSSYENYDQITVGALGGIIHAASSTLFTDNTGTEVATFTTTDNLFVTVHDANSNLDGTTVETFTINVTAGTDAETITLTETGIATGIFRNTTPLTAVSSPTVIPGNGQISIAADAVGATTYTDAQDAGDSLSDTATLIFTGSAGTPAGGGGGGGGGGGLPPVIAEPSVDDATQARLDKLAEIGIAVHSLVKLQNDGDVDTQHDTAVYYVATDGRRHAFSNHKIYFTWYADFAGVQEISLEKLSSIPLGTNVTYKPGVKMVKFTTDDKAYAVSKGGMLHWVTTEAAAIELYGDKWNENIDDISDAFYLDYGFGPPDIASIADFDPATHQASVTYPSDSLK
jgi:hypothetical protein